MGCFGGLCFTVWRREGEKEGEGKDSESAEENFGRRAGSVEGWELRGGWLGRGFLLAGEGEGKAAL